VSLYDSIIASFRDHVNGKEGKSPVGMEILLAMRNNDHEITDPFHNIVRKSRHGRR
jgi:hypothetical protein